MPTKRKPPIPVSGVVYGEIIYWGTCISALLVLVGTILSFLETGSSVSVSYLLDAALAGKTWTQFGLHLTFSKYRIYHFIFLLGLMVRASQSSELLPVY